MNMLQIARRRGLWLITLAALVVGGCRSNDAVFQPPTQTVLTEATPTIPATIIPGTAADERAVRATIQQFGDALARDDEVVALLLLSPSAQQIVASKDLYALIGATERATAIDVRAVEIDATLASATCTIRFGDRETLMRLHLVRLDGDWKIDAFTKL